MGRGLYGQSEGNESRSSVETMEDQIADNEIAEGLHVKKLRCMAKARDWAGYTEYYNKLTAEGFSKARLDSMVVRSTWDWR